jgi:hypothetical protein
MLGGDSQELTDTVLDAIGQTWQVLICGERASRESMCRGDFGSVDGITR